MNKPKRARTKRKKPPLLFKWGNAKVLPNKNRIVDEMANELLDKVKMRKNNKKEDKCEIDYMEIPKGHDIFHPSHYTHLPNGIECWDVTEHFTANIAQAMKYQWRSGRKNGTPATKDLRKAIQFIQREIDLLEGRNPKMNKTNV